jgi:hypothetical protein
MATTTGILSLLQPVGSDPPSELRVAVGANATATGDAFVPSYTLGATSMTAAANDIVIAAPSTTVTLPSPTENAIVGVVASASVTGAAPVTVSYGSAVIFGPGLSTSGASSFLLGAPEASALLMGTGTAWQTVAGSQDTGWVPLASYFASGVVALGTSYTPAARLVGATVRLTGYLETSSGTVTQWLTLPATFRPVSVVSGVTQINTSTNLGISIYSVTSGGSVSTSAASQVSLDGIAPFRLV